MIRTILAAVLPVLACGPAWAQPAGGSTVFESASVKPALPPGGRSFHQSMRGGPGTDSPTQIDYRNVSIVNLIVRAYGVKQYQLSVPDWMTIDTYDIVARVPPGTGEEQFRLMLQSLLAERFKLQFHRETQQLPMYFLTAGEDGPKLTPHVEAEPQETSRNGKGHLQGENRDLAWLAGQLSVQLRATVKDETGLNGKYDFSLSWPEQSGSGPDLIAAVQTQLGLKLSAGKAPLEILVVDNAEPLPSGN